MTDLLLSPLAESDLRRIFLYGLERFGALRAAEYREGINNRFQQIVTNPLRYPEVASIKAGYRRSVYIAHSIYYRIENDQIVILRILGRQDVSRILG